VISYYLQGNQNSFCKKLFNNEYNKEEFHLHEISITGKLNNEVGVINEDDEIELITDITLKALNGYYHITYHLYNEMGQPMFSFSHSGLSLKKGRNRLQCSFPKSFFNPGNYYLSFFVIKNKSTAIFVQRDIIGFTIVDAQRELGVYMGREPGDIKPKFNWKISYLND
jgi:lipopolysaccharide transport system ATP-binding protein